MDRMSKRVEPYSIYHSMLLDSHSVSRDYYNKVDSSTSFSGVIGSDHVICIAGVQPIWDGVGYAWVRFSEDAREHKFWLYKNSKKYLNLLVVKNKLWRVHATVACNHMAGCSWIESFGFEMESTLKEYGPYREDHYMYRKIYEV